MSIPLSIENGKKELPSHLRILKETYRATPPTTPGRRALLDWQAQQYGVTPDAICPTADPLTHIHKSLPDREALEQVRQLYGLAYPLPDEALPLGEAGSLIDTTRLPFWLRDKATTDTPQNSFLPAHPAGSVSFQDYLLPTMPESLKSALQRAATSAALTESNGRTFTVPPPADLALSHSYARTFLPSEQFPLPPSPIPPNEIHLPVPPVQQAVTTPIDIELPSVRTLSPAVVFRLVKDLSETTFLTFSPQDQADGDIVLQHPDVPQSKISFDPERNSITIMKGPEGLTLHPDHRDIIIDYTRVSAEGNSMQRIKVRPSSPDTQYIQWAINRLSEVTHNAANGHVKDERAARLSQDSNTVLTHILVLTIPTPFEKARAKFALTTQKVRGKVKKARKTLSEKASSLFTIDFDKTAQARLLVSSPLAKRGSEEPSLLGYNLENSRARLEKIRDMLRSTQYADPVEAVLHTFYAQPDTFTMHPGEVSSSIVASFGMPAPHTEPPFKLPPSRQETSETEAPPISPRARRGQAYQEMRVAINGTTAEFAALFR